MRKRIGILMLALALGGLTAGPANAASDDLPCELYGRFTDLAARDRDAGIPRAKTLDDLRQGLAGWPGPPAAKQAIEARLHWIVEVLYDNPFLDRDVASISVQIGCLKH